MSDISDQVDVNEYLIWTEGYPNRIYFEDEWFIAVVNNVGRVVLRALPEEYSYDFTTAEGTYFKKEVITKWMQFPDSEFIPLTFNASNNLKSLINAIHEVSIQVGIANKDTFIDGPQALLLLDDIKKLLEVKS